MKHFKSLLVVLLFLTGTISAMAGPVYDYEMINGVKYLCLHSTYHAYIVSLPPIYNTEVTIPKTIQHYQNYVLKNYEAVGFEKGIMVPKCYGVHSLELPEGFSFNNANLEKVLEKVSFETINNAADGSCSLLIGSYAFSQTGIESIYIPKNVKSISAFTFSSCNNLASIVVAADNEIYDSRNGCNAIIRKIT